MPQAEGGDPVTTRPTFAHVVYRTSQMAAMRDWYCSLLDAHVVHEGEGLSFLTYDDEHHRVALLESAEPLERKSVHAAWTHHVAYTFPDLASLLERYVKLKVKGVEPAMPIQHGVTTSLYYEDPDGNLVEMQIDNFATPDEATAYMQGEEYSADPRGPRFSPEAMLTEFRSGVPAAALITRAWAAAHPHVTVSDPP
jgi:catechol-2,3-dioxygenase